MGYITWSQTHNTLLHFLVSCLISLFYERYEQDIENTRWVSFDIKITRQGFENACWHREACRDIENTRWVSFDIKITRQGFENACWHREACRAIQHAFSKPSLVKLISKDANLVFYLSVYPSLITLQTSDYDVIFHICVDSASLATSFKKCNVIMTR